MSQETTDAPSLSAPSAGFRVLVVDDDPNILKLLARILEPKGFEAEYCLTGEEGLEKAMAGGFQVIILDAMLPGIQGVEVAEAIRKGGRTTPILMLTGITSSDFLVRALDAGADDFLTKPFVQKELLARVRALGRRGAVVPKVEIGRVRLDPLERTVTVDERVARLTTLEHRLVMTLASAGGEFVTRETLLEGVWGMEFDPGTNLVYSHITNIRKKLDEVGGGDLIVSERGKGYRFAAAPSHERA